MLNRTKVKNISIYILLGITYGIEAVSLEFNPPLVIGEPLCPMDILMTCKAVNVAPLRWFAVIDDDNTCIFAEHDSDRYEFYSTCLPGVSENYTSVHVNAPFFDINTTLNINLISLAPVKGIYCQTKSNIMDVDIKIQGDMFRVNYTATYSDDGRLMEIEVQWEDVMDSFVCDVNITYEVELRTNGSSESITLNTENCRNKVCLIIFHDLMDKTTGSYEVRVLARNQFITEAEVYTSSITIMSNIMDIIEKNGCNLSIRCPTSFNGKCIVLNDLEDSSSSEVVQLSRTFNLTLSISQQKIPLEVITFNDSLRVILKYNYTTDTERITDANTGWIVAGIVLFSFYIVLLVVVLIMLPWRKKKMFAIILGTTSVGMVVIDVILWIAVMILVLPQRNTCDISWQSSRDGLIVATVIIIFIFFIILLLSTLVIVKYKCKVDKFPVSHLDESPEKRGADVILDLYGVKEDECVIDDSGRSKAERNVSISGHRREGESVQEVMLRHQNVITNAVKEKMVLLQENNSQIAQDEDGNLYDTTNFQTTSKPNPHPQIAGPSEEYSGLSRPDDTKCHTKDTHYQHLHELPVKNPNGQDPSIQSIDSTYSRLEMSGAQNKVSGKDAVQHKGQDSRSDGQANEQEKKKKRK